MDTGNVSSSSSSRIETEGSGKRSLDEPEFLSQSHKKLISQNARNTMVSKTMTEKRLFFRDSGD